MASPPLITINGHTTSSVPRPHILYNVQVTKDGKHAVVQRRYSDFVALHNTLGAPATLTLPPKRILTTTFVPSAWLDDALIAERKAGLREYLDKVVRMPEHAESQALQQFLSGEMVTGAKKDGMIDLEDAVPSTLSRNKALELKAQALAGGEVGVEATPIYASYYPDWSVDSNPPESLDFSKFDIVFFAFAMPNSSNTLSWDSGGTSILKRLVAAKKASGKSTKIVLSIGGWGGSTYFHQATNSANRDTFVNAIVSAVNTYGVDGIDIDWEYPNSPGAGNPFSGADAKNLYYLFTHLRDALGSSKILSAAVTHLPWLDTNGNPLTDVSTYASVMNYVNIMNYDVWGASSNPGPNAPLGNLCGTSTQPQASAQAALAQWKAAGFPASKMLLGLPLYGYVSQSSKTSLTGSLLPSDVADSNMVVVVDNGKEGKERAFLNGAHPRDKKAVEKGKEVEAEANVSLKSWYGQQIPFSTLVTSGALVRQADGTYAAGGGFTFAWDDCSDTPFLYKTSETTVVTYDDTWSLGDKATFAKQNGMAGCFTWSLDQDDGYNLQNAIRKSLGK